MNRLLRTGVLLSFAVMVGCVSEGKYKAEVAAEQGEAAQVSQLTALNQQLSANLSADEATIQQLQNELKVTMVDKVLFAEGGHTLNVAGKKTLDKIAPTLAPLTGQRVVVKAFTDNVPIGPALRARYPTNMDLSSARADEVVRYLSKGGVPMGILAAEGLGESNPVASNDTPEGRAQNRRVEVVIQNASM